MSTRVRQSIGRFAADLRLARRRLARRLGFTLSALVIFGLGIGFTTAVVGVYRALFARPLPYPDPDRLVAVVTTYPDPTQPSDENAAGTVDLLRWRSVRSFAALGAHTPRDLAVLVGDRVESVKGEAVTASLLALLGATPVLGRVFTEEEDRNAADVAVLGDAFWGRLGRDPAIVGRALRIDGRPHVVVGVLPPSFTTLFQQSDLYVPLGVSEAHPGLPGRRTLAVTARLAPGVTPAEAGAELATVAANLAKELPDSHRGWGTRVKSLREQFFGSRRPVFRLLAVGIALVLLIGCANLAHLALAGAAARRGEFALRAALGASRADLWRQEAVESLVLALGGSGLGLVVSVGATRLMLGLDPDLARLAGPVPIDLTLVATAVALGIAAAQLGATIPTLWAGRSARLVRTTSRSTGGLRDRFLRQALLAGEVALSLVLLVGGGVLVRGLASAMREDPGFRPENVVAAEVVLPSDRYAEQSARTSFVTRVLDDLRARPAVAAAGTTMTRFRPAMSMQTSIQVDGQAGEPSAPSTVHLRRVAPGYLAAMGARLVAGREFTTADDPTAPKVAMISASMAKRFWPDRDPIGLRFKRPPSAPDWITVVGVLADARDSGPGFDLGAVIFLPYAQNSAAGVSWSPVTLLVRMRGGEADAVKAIVSAVKSVDPDLAVESPMLLERHLEGALAPQRFQAVLVGSFALTALLLAVAGLYGVTSYGVAQQRREIGIRLALGAVGSGVTALVVRRAMVPLFLGLAIGAVGSVWASSAAGRLLPRPGGLDPALVAGVAALLAGVGLIACMVPALGASRVDPAVSLRE